MLVDLDATTVVEFESNGCDVQAIGIRNTSDRHDQFIDFKRLQAIVIFVLNDNGLFLAVTSTT